MNTHDTTVIYYTDSILEEPLATKCRDMLLKSAAGLPIVSVSQKPVDLGENICVGDMGRSWLSLYKQLFEGVKAAKTTYVAMAEHDCLYSTEHLSWKPPDDSKFYYNDNCWLLQWDGTHKELNGMFSFWPNRYALSQMICNRDLLYSTIDKRLEIIDADRKLIKLIANFAEPGRTKLSLERVQKWARSGKSIYLRPMLDAFSEYLETEHWELFKTRTPNVDIRHNGNFTGPKRGKNRRWELPPWGTLREISKCID